MHIVSILSFDKLYKFAIKEHGYVKLMLLLLFILGCRIIFSRGKILYEMVIRCLDSVDGNVNIIFSSSLYIFVIGIFIIFISIVIYILLFLSKASSSTLVVENAKLRKRVTELENAALRGDRDDIPYTLWREVLAMRDTGMTDKEIAEKLHDKGQGASKAQLGALLYSGNAKIPAQKTLQDYGTELFR